MKPSAPYEVQICVAHFEKVAIIRIIGRATFKISQQLREFGMGMLHRDIVSVIFELSECYGMDSTILGVIAMIGLEGRGKSEVVVVNANDTVRSQLESVGLSKLCRFACESVENVNWDTLCRAAAGAVTMDSVADTVLEAHKTLMNLEPQNIPKFRDVVEILSQEMDQRKK